MRQSQIPDFIKKEFPKDEESYNAKILIRAGFVDKLMAGVFSYLPFGLKVLKKIENIVRKEMDGIGASEILMPVLAPKENWEKTGRWQAFDVLFKVISRDKKEYALGPTHEEVVVPLSQKAIFSYKDLSFGVYQIQTKLRDEPRAKSGLLRGREFLMKDLYSFHISEKDQEEYYEKVIQAYQKIFKAVGVNAILVEASGGTFSKFSHEFQALTENGEDEIIHCKKCGFAQNREINDSKMGDKCPKCGKPLFVSPASEVANIFHLKTKYSDPFGLSFKDEKGDSQPVIMGCYGLGISRLMGVLAEIFHDEKGLLWPEGVSPFAVHLLAFFGSGEKEEKSVSEKSEEVYKELSSLGIDSSL